MKPRRAAVAYGNISSGEFGLFTRLGWILTSGAVGLRHRRHNRKSLHVGQSVAPDSLRLLPVARRAANLPGIVQLDLDGLLVLALNGVVYLAAMNRNFARRLNPEPNLIAAHVDDGDDDVIAYNDTFVALSGENEHVSSMIGNATRRTLDSRATITT